MTKTVFAVMKPMWGDLTCSAPNRVHSLWSKKAKAEQVCILDGAFGITVKEFTVDGPLPEEADSALAKMRVEHGQAAVNRFIANAAQAAEGK